MHWACPRFSVSSCVRSPRRVPIARSLSEQALQGSGGGAGHRQGPAAGREEGDKPHWQGTEGQERGRGGQRCEWREDVQELTIQGRLEGPWALESLPQPPAPVSLSGQPPPPALQTVPCPPLPSSPHPSFPSVLPQSHGPPLSSRPLLSLLVPQCLSPCPCPTAQASPLFSPENARLVSEFSLLSPNSHRTHTPPSESTFSSNHSSGRAVLLTQSQDLGG